VVPIGVASQLIPPRAYPQNPPRPAITVKVLSPRAWSSANDSLECGVVEMGSTWECHV
jgi:hypothetical protein